MQKLSIFENSKTKFRIDFVPFLKFCSSNSSRNFSKAFRSEARDSSKVSILSSDKNWSFSMKLRKNLLKSAVQTRLLKLMSPCLAKGSTIEGSALKPNLGFWRCGARKQEQLVR